MSLIERLVELWRDSVVMQSLLALVVVVVVAWMRLSGIEVDEEWWGLVGLVFGYYFGSDKVVAIRRFVAGR